MQLRVDSDELISFTNRLEILGKNKFPSAVRATLNDLAFDVKLNTMPDSAEKEFIRRDKNFFKANSTVNMAKGFEVRSMQSMVGFFHKKKGNQAVDDLEQQEEGGKIGGRSFIATDKARITGSIKRKVSKRNQAKRIKNVIKTKGNKANFVRSVFKAGKGGHVLHENMLFRVDGIRSTKSGPKFRLAAIQSYKKNRSVDINATHFMEKAVKMTRKKTNDFYKKEAEKRFQ